MGGSLVGRVAPGVQEGVQSNEARLPQVELTHTGPLLGHNRGRLTEAQTRTPRGLRLVHLQGQGDCLAQCWATAGETSSSLERHRRRAVAQMARRLQRQEQQREQGHKAVESMLRTGVAEQKDIGALHATSESICGCANGLFERPSRADAC